MDFSLVKSILSNRHKSFNDILLLAKKAGKNKVFVAGGAIREIFSGNTSLRGDIDVFIADEVYSYVDALKTSYGKIDKNQFGGDRWYPEEENSFYYDLAKISEFYHGLWRCKDIVDVLNQFDITANAIAIDLYDGTCFDIENGIRDAQNKVLRAVRFDFPEKQASPIINISRNSILWFRYNHYYFKLGYEIEPITLNWIKENSYRKKDLEVFKKYFYEPRLIL